MSTTPGIAAVAVALVSSTLLLHGCGGAEARRASHIERGQEYYARGNYEKARVEFRNAMQITPNDAEARFLSAQTAEKLGNLREAVGLYQSTIDADAKHVRARANLGRMLVFAGAPQRAQEMIAPALETHPEDPDLLTVRGAARIQLNDRAGALSDVQRAVALAPQNENALALLASLYRQGGEHLQAIDLIQSALTRAPQSVDLRQVLASLYLTVNEPLLAGEQLRQIVELQPRELAPRLRLAMHYNRLKQLDEADKTLRDAVAALPESDDAKLAYIELLSTQRSREQGEKALRDFIARDPKDYGLQLGLGALQQRTGGTDDALATYAKIVASDSEGLSGLTARNRIAAIHVARSEYDKALTLLEQTLEKNPRDNDALVLRGNIALERSDAAAAIADLRAVLRDQPGSVGVLRTLARAHLANGEPALAEENIRAALEAAPYDATVRIELAQLLAQTNRAEQAVTLLEEVVRTAPTNVVAREALARTYIAARDLDAARVAAEELKAAAPDRASGHYLAAMVAQAQRRTSDAQTELERALQIQPQAMDALAALIRIEVEQGRAKAALARVGSLVTAEPKNAVAHNLLGELHLATKDYAHAMHELQAAVELAPKWWLPHRNLALARIAAGDLAGGIAAYEAGIVATRHEPALVTDLAALYERNGRVDDAIRQYEALYKTRPRFDLAANNLAMLLVTYRTDQASLDRARDLTAAFASSQHGALLDTHAWVRFKRGEYTQALPLLERAMEQVPDSKMIRYHLAMAQLRAGRRDEARSNLEAALSGSATFAGAEEARSMLADLKTDGGRG